MSFVDHTQRAIAQSSSWARSQRWFGEKARNLQSIQASHVVEVELPRTHGILAIVEYRFEGGSSERYFLPLTEVPHHTHGNGSSALFPLGRARDAFSESEFLTWLLDGFTVNRLIDNSFQLQWRRVDGGDLDFTTIENERATVLSGEQSNTSVVYDDRVILKAFRRMQPGNNPDVEVSEFLSSRTTFAHSPRVIGVIEATIEGEPFTLASLQTFVASHGDGWQWLRGHLAQFDDEDHDWLLESIDQLATTTADMHIALASDGDDQAFASERISAGFVARGIRQLQTAVEAAVAALLQRELLGPEEADGLATRLGKVAEGYAGLEGTERIRVHGDYHLGQVLRTVDGAFAVIDFEGEPARPIAERRAKHSGLKDVTGMLRSLDYAVATLRRESVSAKHRHALAAWSERARSTFITAYRRKVMAKQPELLPGDEDHFNAALATLELEKALYEVHYELNNRPNWVSIPLDALRRFGG